MFKYIFFLFVTHIACITMIMVFYKSRINFRYWYTLVIFIVFLKFTFFIVKKLLIWSWCANLLIERFLLLLLFLWNFLFYTFLIFIFEFCLLLFMITVFILTLIFQNMVKTISRFRTFILPELILFYLTNIIRRVYIFIHRTLLVIVSLHLYTLCTNFWHHLLNVDFTLCFLRKFWIFYSLKFNLVLNLERLLLIYTILLTKNSLIYKH